MKVYELAKKLEVKSVFLMDKIRKEWKLPVKTHMELLTPELIEQIEQKFYSSQKSKKLKKAPAKTKASSTQLVKKTKSLQKKEKTKETKKATKKSPQKIKKQIKKSAKVRAKSLKKAATKARPTKVKKMEEQPKKEPSAQSAKKVIIRRKAPEEKPISAKQTLKPPSALSGSPVEAERELPSVSRFDSTKVMRQDLVSFQSSDPLDDVTWTEKAEPVKKQPKKPLAEKDLSSKFNATDFRKREVIFQPRKKRTALNGEFKSTPITTPKSRKRIVKVHGEMSLDGLCRKMSIKKQALSKKLKEEGVPVKGLSTLDFETIALIVPSFGFEAKNTKQTEKELLNRLQKTEEDQKHKVEWKEKPPVVAVMGHVDHGKTTLLDRIRKTNVAKGEAGGITQSIGAYSVFLNQKPITFIDTPGHEAFAAMRSRGAKVTDIVVLVVSAVDGVMPQTIEALNHARAAKSALIVAVNKMDSPGADLEKIKKEMSEHNLLPEDWGGETAFIPLSALKGEGIQDLLERIQLTAEIQELKCRKTGRAEGFVLESRKEKGLGPTASLLVRNGTLKIGQYILAGDCSGKIRQMKDDQGITKSLAEPGFPIEVTGLEDLPSAGDSFYSLKDEKTLKNILNLKRDEREELLKKQEAEESPEELLKKIEEKNKKAERKELNLILKADANGSLEALKSSLEKIQSEEASLKIVHSGTGAIVESDVLLASAVSGIVLGFNVRSDGKAARAGKAKSIQILEFSVIYELLDQVQKLLLSLLKPETLEEEQGQAEVRELFRISKLGIVAGCYVTKGQIQRNSFVRVVRDGRIVHDGLVSGLRRFKENVPQISSGMECGVSLKNFNDIKPKDILESYIKKERARTEL